MPNTQTSVPLYASGEVLTAANLNLTNSGIPVFATTVTRDAAFGGANEKVLAEGQFAYIEATNTTQYYDGAAWQTVGVTPGLVCVKAETAFTTAASVTADNVFTSAYTNYRLMLRTQAGGNITNVLQLRVGGVTATGANYNAQFITANNTSITGSRSLNSSSLAFAGANGAFFTVYVVDIFAPALAEPTQIVNQIANADGAYTTPYLFLSGGNHTLSTDYDGFIVTPSSSTLTGTYTVYGYGKTV